MSYNFNSNFNLNNYNLIFNSYLDSNIYIILKELKLKYKDNSILIKNINNLEILFIYNNFKDLFNNFTLSKYSFKFRYLKLC